MYKSQDVDSQGRYHILFIFEIQCPGKCQTPRKTLNSCCLNKRMNAPKIHMHGTDDQGIDDHDIDCQTQQASYNQGRYVYIILGSYLSIVPPKK